MARGNGKRYDEAFQIETVKYINENYKSVAQVAREICVYYLDIVSLQFIWFLE